MDSGALIAVSEALSILPIRRRKQGKLLLQISGMLNRGYRHGDFFSISKNGDWDIFVSGEKEGSIKDIGR